MPKNSITGDNLYFQMHVNQYALWNNHRRNFCKQKSSQSQYRTQKSPDFRISLLKVFWKSKNLKNMSTGFYDQRERIRKRANQASSQLFSLKNFTSPVFSFLHFTLPVNFTVAPFLIFSCSRISQVSALFLTFTRTRSLYFWTGITLFYDIWASKVRK